VKDDDVKSELLIQDLSKIRLVQKFCAMRPTKAGNMSEREAKKIDRAGCNMI